MCAPKQVTVISLCERPFGPSLKGLYKRDSYLVSPSSARFRLLGMLEKLYATRLLLRVPGYLSLCLTTLFLGEYAALFFLFCSFLYSTLRFP